MSTKIELTPGELRELIKAAVRDGVREALCHPGGAMMPVIVHTQPFVVGKEYGGGNGGRIASLGSGGG